MHKPAVTVLAPENASEREPVDAGSRGRRWVEGHNYALA